MQPPLLYAFRGVDAIIIPLRVMVAISATVAPLWSVTSPFGGITMLTRSGAVVGH
jgi:hypothetical protein